jgi:hypothetical protein
LQGCVFFALNRGQSAKIGLIWVGGADRNRTGVAPFIVHSECRSERQINWLNFPSFFGMARDRLSFGVGSSSRSCELDRTLDLMPRAYLDNNGAKIVQCLFPVSRSNVRLTQLPLMKEVCDSKDSQSSWRSSGGPN